MTSMTSTEKELICYKSNPASKHNFSMQNKLKMKQNNMETFDVEKQPLKSNSKCGGARACHVHVRNRYKSSFTIHALNHIVDGTLPEKIIWSVKLLAAIGIAVYLCWNLFVDYFTYKVTSNVRIEVKQSMKAPTVFLCTKDYKMYSKLFTDCSSKDSLRYNVDICSAVTRGCPPVFHEEPSSIRGNRSEDICAPQLLGQCVGFNMDGKTNISHVSMMYFEKHVNRSVFPLTVYLALPGSQSPLGHFHEDDVSDFGDYTYNLDKTSFRRLPAPYSNPSCLIKGTPESKKLNVFHTEYRIESCRKTCWFEWYISKCGIISIEHRINLREDIDFKKRLRSGMNEAEVDACVRNATDEMYKGGSSVEKCINACPLPCDEVKYDTKLVRKPLPEPHVGFSFDFRTLKEFKIEETPSFDMQTLIGTFGGTLGLMTGMSALSILELLVWAGLYFTDRFYSAYKKVKVST